MWRGGAALCRQHDRLDGQGHLRNGAAPGDPAGLQREERRGADGVVKASNSILSFLELSRKLKQDGPDADLVEVVGKAAKALENDPDSGLALGGVARVDRSARSQDEGGGQNARL